MFDDLSLFADAIFQTLTVIFNLYTTVGLFGACLALWLIRKVVNVYRHL